MFQTSELGTGPEESSGPKQPKEKKNTGEEMTIRPDFVWLIMILKLPYQPANTVTYSMFEKC